MKVASYLPKENQPRTARTWAIHGYVVNAGENGEEMWTNGNRKVTSTYFTPDQVHPADEKELEEFWKPVKAARAERAKQRRQKERERIERLTAPLRKYLDEHQGSKDELIQSVCKAAKFAIRECKKNRHDASPWSYFRVDIPSSDLAPVISESIILDTETTGLRTSDGAEIIQLSIINQDGEVLFNEYFKPMFSESWEAAMKVNGITPEMVSDKPCIYEKLPEILAILRGAGRVIGYNTPFDLGMLGSVGAELPEEIPVEDVMRDFAPIYGEYNEERGAYKWQSLTTCAAYYGYDWGKDAAHDSLADCRATLFCYKKMRDQHSEK